MGVRRGVAFSRAFLKIQILLILILLPLSQKKAWNLLQTHYQVSIYFRSMQPTFYNVIKKTECTPHTRIYRNCAPYVTAATRLRIYWVVYRETLAKVQCAVSSPWRHCARTSTGWRIMSRKKKRKRRRIFGDKLRGPWCFEAAAKKRVVHAPIAPSPLEACFLSVKLLFPLTEEYL